MKTIHWVPITAFALISTSCERKSSARNEADPQLAQQVAELERKSNQAIARQLELERELENQKLATEREAIERERQLIEEARYELEQKESESAAAEAAALLQREKDLAAREGKVEFLQTTLEEKQSKLKQQESELSERDRQLAGREAIALQDQGAEEVNVPVGDYGMFYDSLSSYGSWFESPDYGYVWQPVVVRDVSWRPYTRGRWACSDQGWTWISDEPFGWATYHYGRWALCRNRGWIWVPGSQWAPSWVSWRSSGNHVGWAPLPPETLAWQENRWDSSVDTTFGIGAPWFVFVETRHFGNPIHHHCLPYDRNPIFIQQTINITHIHVHNRRIICGGPTYGDVQKQVERPLPFYRLEMDRHNRYRDSVSMRPRVEGNRLRVSAPNLANPWNRGLRPEKLRGRLDDMQVVRTQEMKPEIKERFQQVREEEKRKADDTIRNMGGENELRRRRLEQMAQNQQAAEEKRRRDSAIATRPNGGRAAPNGVPDSRPPVKPDTVPGSGNNSMVILPDRMIDGKPAVMIPDRHTTPVKPAVTPGSGPRFANSVPVRPSTAPPTKPSNDPEKPPVTPGSGPRMADSKPSQPSSQETGRNTSNGMEDSRPANNGGGPRINPNRPAPEQPSQVDGDRMRQQQLEAQKQREQQQQARQLQMEEARREQQREAQRQREQQEEARRREQAQARQQQMEEARREQQREAQRQQQEQARREQMEQARREQARQEQQERARQQQMEEARREQARQEQQREAQRQRDQQERQRQQQEQEERRNRNR